MKQSKLRRKRVFRYAALYFLMLAVFVGLIVGPVVAGGFIPDDVTELASFGDMDLFQPTNLNNDDTQSTTLTGTGAASYSGYLVTRSKFQTASEAN